MYVIAATREFGASEREWLTLLSLLGKENVQPQGLMRSEGFWLNCLRQEENAFLARFSILLLSRKGRGLSGLCTTGCHSLT